MSEQETQRLMQALASTLDPRKPIRDESLSYLMQVCDVSFFFFDFHEWDVVSFV